ncbi:MAG: DNA-processing protein DprA [Candidatus Omnitrophota bacterium]|nr:MAG: DNA-processing protein DprA [Candidatus Omnitrophota bacterium]
MIVEIDSPEYPELLKKIEHPPQRLYYKGSWDNAIFEKCLAVVGSRKMSNYGKQITNKLVSEIAQAGITIVSGFMYGVDATAHKAALEAGGKTIAVMPCGIEMIHPERQENLYKEILENKGLIISELEGAHPPALWTYPRRNRIMAGLSIATLVIEAGLKSGSLITAALARKYKRRLFAVPGPLTSSLSQGTLELIKEGADVVISAQDVLQCYGLKAPEELSGAAASSSAPFSILSKLEQNILEKLRQEPLEIDALSRMAKVSASEMGTTLSLMELKGLLTKEEGRYYVK